MLDALSKGFRAVKERIQGQRTLTEENIEEATRELRVSLIEADVDVKVMREFIKKVKDRAIGEIVQVSAKQGDKKVSATPGDHFIYICQKELEDLMGPVDSSFVYSKGISKVMMIGLQGAGKTTTTGKLARLMLEEGRKPMLVAADIYRPAAVDQLKVLGARLEIPVFHLENTPPPQICAKALDFAKENHRDVVIFDTAGRLAIDEQLMEELKEIKALTTPENTILVVDAMIGQDAVRTAKTFDDQIGITGFIMTKLDGDARGGAALSIKSVTGKPIKFLGMGEGLEQLEPFRPEGLASRIMGFGDIVGLMKDFEKVVDEEQATKDAQKMFSGKFDMMDFLNQIRMIRQMGPLSELMEKMPFFGGGMAQGMNVDEKQLVRVEAIIQSMTPLERTKPEIIEKEPSRAQRIGKGSGIPPKEIIDLVGRFKMMKKFMGALGGAGGGGLLSKIPGFKQFAQMQKLKGGNLDDLFGDLGDLANLGNMPGMPKGGMPKGGFPGGMPKGGFPGGMPPNLNQLMAGLPPNLGGGQGGGLLGGLGNLFGGGMPNLGNLGALFGGGQTQNSQTPSPQYDFSNLPNGYLPPGTQPQPRKTNVAEQKQKEKARKKAKDAQKARRNSR